MRPKQMAEQTGGAKCRSCDRPDGVSSVLGLLESRRLFGEQPCQSALTWTSSSRTRSSGALLAHDGTAGQLGRLRQQRAVPRLGRQQLGVRSDDVDPPVDEHRTRSARSTVEGRWATDERCRRRQHVPQCRLHLRFGLHVQRGERVVRVPALAAGRARLGPAPAAVAAHPIATCLAPPIRVSSPNGQLVDEARLRDLRASARLASLASGRPERDVLPHARRRTTSHPRTLVATVAREFVEAEIANVASADGDGSGGHVGIAAAPTRAASSCRIRWRRPGAMVSPSRMVSVDATDASSSASGYRKCTSWNSSPRCSRPQRHRRWPVDDRRLLVEYLEDSSCRRRRFLSQGEAASRGAIIGQISRRYSVRKATSCPGLSVPCAAANTPPPATPASKSCGRPSQQRPEPHQRADFGEFRAAQDARIMGERCQHLRAPTVRLDHSNAEADSSTDVARSPVRSWARRASRL